MPIRLSDTELERLQGLPHFARSLYVFGLRPYMDYRTGIVGVARGISWQSIAEALYVEPHQGEVDGGTPDKSRVRRAADRLKRGGLIDIRSEGKRLIVQCLLAATDESVSNKPDTNPTQTRHSKPDTSSSYSDVAFHEEPDTNPTQTRHSKPDTPPVSGSPVRTNSLDIDTSRARSRFAEFWAAYPKKVGKAPAEAKWKAKRLDAMADQILADITIRQSQDRKWLDGFIPNPLTYLTQERWADEIERAKENPMRAATTAPGFGNQPRKAANDNRKVRNDDFGGKQYVGTPADDIDWMQ